MTLSHRLIAAGAFLALPLQVIADDTTWDNGGSWSGDEPKISTGTGRAQVAGDTLKLFSDTDATFTTTGLTGAKSNGAVTIEVDPATTSSGKTVTLNGPLYLGFYTTLNVTSSHGYTLSLPNVSSDKPSPILHPTTANLAVGTLSGTGNIKLGGTSTGNTLGLFTGTYLQQDSGTWTLTGDNSANTWSLAVGKGANFVLPIGAALGKGTVAVLGTFSPKAGASCNENLSFNDGSHLNLADGTVGTFTEKGQFGGPNGGSVYIDFDVGPAGPDSLIISTTSNTNDIKDYVVLHLLSDHLTPGTYKLVTLENGNIIENHLGFDFTGDPANHDNIVKTKTIGGYTFTLNTLDASGESTNYQGNYSIYTLTIAETPK